MGDGILNRLRAGAVGLYRFAVPTGAFISSATTGLYRPIFHT